MKRSYLLLVLISFALSGISCSVYETIVNISRLKFKLGDVNNFLISGVSVSNKSRVQDFSAVEILKISSAFAEGKLPVSFTLNVEAKNPNDGTGGYARTNATIESFPWRLEIDDKETISGNIGSAVTVPGTGEITAIPITINVDLLDFFKDRGYESLINLALSIGGYNSSGAKLALFARPTVKTTLGNITYPNELKIVSFDFTN